MISNINLQESQAHLFVCVIKKYVEGLCGLECVYHVIKNENKHNF